METVVIFDGDVLAYLACKPRRMTSNGKIIVHLDEEGDKFIPEHTPEEDTQYLMDSWDNFVKIVEKTCDKFFTSTYVMAVKGPDNFRDTVYPEYKQNRRVNSSYVSEMAKFVPDLRRLAVHGGMAIESAGYEADDYVRFWAEECKKYGRDYVIVSIDKDLRCIPGKHYNPKTEVLDVVEELKASLFYHQQLMQGDSTDNIPGIPGVGPVKASKMLDGCTTVEEMQEVVVGAYVAAYNDDWVSALLSNGKLLHIMRHHDDYFSFKEWSIAREIRGLLDV